MIEKLKQIHNKEPISKEDLKILEKHDYIRIVNNIPFILNKGSILIYEDYIRQYQELFPKIRVNGFQIRTNLRELTLKFDKFFKLYPNYSWNEIIKATKKYIEEKKANNWEYIRMAKYFILKQVNGEEISDLATYIDNLDEESIKTSIGGMI